MWPPLAAALLLACALGACAPVDDGGGDELAEGEATASTLPSSSPWASPEACEAAVAAGHHAYRHAGTVRMATWNVRWFPDGVAPDSGSTPKPTNTRWLACAIAYMGVDLVALEEVLTHDRARAAMAEVTDHLRELTGHEWRAEIDLCADPNVQHQGVLYNTDRVAVQSERDFDWLRGASTQSTYCSRSVRPAWMTYVSFADGGPDFHLAGVHLKSGGDQRSYDLRRQTLAALPALVRDAQAAVNDADVIVAGDFNTMGCDSRDCTQPVDPPTEITSVEQSASGAGFRRMDSALTCSEYSGPDGTLLDHFLVAQDMREVSATARATVSGYCGATRCGALLPGDPPRALRELSDHCPVVLELDAHDAD